MTCIKKSTIVLLISLLTVNIASAATFYVDDSGGADYVTIQEAVDAANPGDMIIVKDGTYTENVDVNKSLTIRSENGAEKTIVQVADSNEPVFNVTANYVTISGFTVSEEGAIWGIALSGDYCNISNNNYLYLIGGIRLENSNYNDISNNNCSGNDVVGIELLNSSNNNIVGNNASNNGGLVGINLLYSSNNNIIGNNASYNRDGIGLHDGSNNNNLIDNNANYNSWFGITLRESSNNNIIGNKVSYNSACDISLVSSSSNTITGNNADHIFLDGRDIWSTSDKNEIYFNNFESGLVWNATNNIWNSPELITYTYNGNTYTNHLGNYWDDYSDVDADGDGIWDNPYIIDGEQDDYPLVEGFENYVESTSVSSCEAICGGGYVAGTTCWKAVCYPTTPSCAGATYTYTPSGDSWCEQNWGSGSKCYCGSSIFAGVLSYVVYDDPAASWQIMDVQTPAGVESGDTLDISLSGELVARFDAGMTLIILYEDSAVGRALMAADYREMNNGVTHHSIQSSPSIKWESGNLVLSVDSDTDDDKMQAHYSVTFYPDGSAYFNKATAVLTDLATDECGMEDGNVGLLFFPDDHYSEAHVDVYDDENMYSWDIGTYSWWGNIDASHALENGDWISLTKPNNDNLKFHVDHSSGYDNEGNPSPLGALIQYGPSRFVVSIARKGVTMDNPTMLPAGEYTLRGWLSVSASSATTTTTTTTTTTSLVTTTTLIGGACEEKTCDEIYGYIANAITALGADKHALLDEKLIKGVITAESDYRQCDGEEILKSSEGALGLMQLMPGTALWLDVDPYNAEDNVKGGIKYLNWLLNTYFHGYNEEFGNRQFALAAYNCGQGHVLNAIQMYCIDAGIDSSDCTWKDHIEGHITEFCKPETRPYVNDVIGRYKTDNVECAKENQPPTCSVKLHKEGVGIDKINVGEGFDIVITDYSGDVEKVRFLSDELQNGKVDEGFTWTDEYKWGESNDDWTGHWDAANKIKTWAFATVGIKEVWAEVKDNTGQTAKCSANIHALAESEQPQLKAPWVGTAKITQGNNADCTDCSHYDHEGIWDNTYAIDVALDVGSDVLATADGIVIWYDDDPSGAGGKELVIDHTRLGGKKFTTVYLHLSEIIVKSGAVKQGQVIAKSGDTGTVTGPHLHFHIWDGTGSYDSHTMVIERLVMKNVGVDSDFREYDARAGELDDNKIAGKYFESNNILQNQPPTCSLSAISTSGNAPLLVIFSMSADDPDGSISSWSLDVDNDGTPEYSGLGNPYATQQHTYQDLGSYTARLTVKDNSGVEGFCEEVIKVNDIGYAIIVAGQAHGPLGLTDRQWFGHSADNAYRVLYNLGFDHNHIFYLNSQRQLKIEGENRVDGPASKDEFQKDLEIIKEKVRDDPVPFILYLVGHGDEEVFVLDSNNQPHESLSSGDLRDMLKDAPFEPALIAIWSCYSGSFINLSSITDSISVKDENRIIITATHEDGEVRMYDLARSSDRFWGNLNEGLSVKEAFVKDVTQSDIEHRLLDDNGDQIGNPPDNLGKDGNIAAKTLIGMFGTKHLTLSHWYVALIHSAGELRVYDSQNRVTGLINGEVKQEIPGSIYDEQDGAVAIFSPEDPYRYELVGTDEGTYGLDITSVEDGEATTFTAIDISTSSNAVHQYSIDWPVLSQGGDGVTVRIDSDGDGVFEQVLTAGAMFTMSSMGTTSTTTLPDVQPVSEFQSSVVFLVVLLLVPALSYLITKSRTD
ncbi:MAG: peptidoglycan DD-metalloendopeptidase family protein [Candidatus Altiarchaeota archaeon]|nr:peptidoglycan DD-metalloendopeptidase family protein [Candidatus Altiarchaeota archaeon]